MRSLCIKTNNNNIIDYLLVRISSLSLNNLYITKSKFKIYNNIIIHYTGNKLNSFYTDISTILADIIICFYEDQLIKNMLSNNYFYFSNFEQEKIFNICIDYIVQDNLSELEFKYDSVFNACYNYISNNKSLILNGFVNFRLKDYMKILDSVVDLSVNKFVVDKEYIEFINLLRTYIGSKSCNSSIVHLVYSNCESILLDEKHNRISFNTQLIDTKYISDISFSSNDLALNTLLTLLPEKIFIHILDAQDDFINTLKLIFDNRVYICNNCDICNVYKLKSFK